MRRLLVCVMVFLFAAPLTSAKYQNGNELIVSAEAVRPDKIFIRAAFKQSLDDPVFRLGCTVVNGEVGSTYTIWSDPKANKTFVLFRGDLVRQVFANSVESLKSADKLADNFVGQFGYDDPNANKANLMFYVPKDPAQKQLIQDVLRDSQCLLEAGISGQPPDSKLVNKLMRTIMITGQKLQGPYLLTD